MLGLNLRDEFLGKRLKGTAIDLWNESQTGATQVAAEQFLDITYPTHDLLKAIEALGPGKGRPVVVIGERGLGKSHLLGAMYHAASNSTVTRNWLANWAARLNDPQIGAMPLRSDMLVIGESLHRQNYKYLWDLLFARHPQGEYIRGKWAGMGNQKTDVPPQNLLLEMFRAKPTVLLLDEFQTWFDGLTDAPDHPAKSWAFNFIQLLSEIAQEHPEILVMVVSVRNGATEAYKQIHRVNPVQIDFKAGGSPERIQQDRRRMLMHRLFINRLQVSESAIEPLVATHVSEYFRLLDIPAVEHDRKRQDYLETWPFAPHLLQLLEDQVLVATDAQETRDLIRILANLYKSRGENSPIITAADFRLDDDAAEIGALLDSVANQHHRNLREKAMRNITAVTEAIPDSRRITPHLQDIFGALWLRSIAATKYAGAEPKTLQLDITRARAIDDNAFDAELAAIRENSFNLHSVGSRLMFKEEENSRARLLATARNDKLFTDGADLMLLAQEIRYTIAGSDMTPKKHHIIVLGRNWQSDPWSMAEEADRPEKWDDRLPLVVVPEDPKAAHAVWGKGARKHVPQRQKTIGFFWRGVGSAVFFFDRDLLVLVRAELKAREWKANDPEYIGLHSTFQGEVRGIIKKRFDRFAILTRWNYADPVQCQFAIETLKVQGSQIPEAMEEVIAKDLFVAEDFQQLAIEISQKNESLGKLMREIQEPRPNGADCIPWLGETLMKEKVLRLCAQGKIAIDSRGMEYLQAQPGESTEAAWDRLKGKLPYVGRQLDEIKLLEPAAVPASGPSGPATIATAGTQFGVSGTPGTIGGFTTSPVSPVQPAGENATPTVQVVSGGNIFGGGTPAVSVHASLSNPATSPVNLIGKLEAWQIGPATQVHNVSIAVAGMTGAQLRNLLKGLPDGIVYSLSLEKEEV